MVGACGRHMTTDSAEGGKKKEAGPRLLRVYRPLPTYLQQLFLPFGALTFTRPSGVDHPH